MNPRHGERTPGGGDGGNRGAALPFAYGAGNAVFEGAGLSLTVNGNAMVDFSGNPGYKVRA